LQLDRHVDDQDAIEPRIRVTTAAFGQQGDGGDGIGAGSGRARGLQECAHPRMHDRLQSPARTVIAEHEAPHRGAIQAS
jgi:hypothetical protein